jgi:hypothetical protein
MSDMSDLRIAIAEFNAEFPRPKMAPLELQGPYDVSKDFCNPYPNADMPGVYVILHNDGSILRIGKASCMSTITSRLSGYFKWGVSGTEGVHKHQGYEEARIIYTIGVPKDRAFEAPAIEEFLIGRLLPRYNRNGGNGY